MTASDAINLYSQLEENHIKIWIDGGWAVDAVLGKQTRLHKDLDIAMQWKDVPMFCALLEKQRYVKIREDNQYNFVLGDPEGREIDVHAFIFDTDGNVVGGSMYPAASLTGTGVIDGCTVRCITPEYLVKFHSGYELKEKDLHDVSAICEKFGIELPDEYVKLKNDIEVLN